MNNIIEYVIIFVLCVFCLFFAVQGAVRLYAELTCPSYGYTRYMVDWKLNSYCIKFENGTEKIVPLSEVE